MPHQNLLKSLFKNEDSYADLKQVTETYPWFAAAHFFLLQKTTVTQPDYKRTAGKTSLHFNNPFLLNYTLNKKAVKQEVAVAPVAVNMENPLSNGIVVKPEDNNKKEELVFEPLYTTDYFASQGIKLSEEVQTQDKLGKQLKSFTDWLKTMKKVHSDNKMPQGNEQIDITVQHLAEKSNKEDDVITESMAEVYAQQGKILKSKEIFRKLSLLNPAKSAYFAAKIEQLKEN